MRINDSRTDILIMGNYYDNNIEIGRYDADFSTIPINKGKDEFSCEPLNGLSIKRHARHTLKNKHSDRKYLFDKK